MCMYTQTLDKHTTQIDVYTQAHTANPPPHTHTRVHAQNVRTHKYEFTQHVCKHGDNKHATLCDNDTGHTCIKSGAHQTHTHTYQ